MNIVQVAQNAKEIMASQNIYCHICGEKQFSPFDKLYVSAYSACVMCTDTVEDVEKRSENIFAIIEGV
jgi:hypothetical protein